MKRRLVAGALGFAVAPAIIAYFALVSSITQPIDWGFATVMALWFAPITAAIAVIAAEEIRP